MTGRRGRAFLSLMQMPGSTTQAPAKFTGRRRAKPILLAVFVILLVGLFAVSLMVVRKFTSAYTDIRTRLSGAHKTATAAKPMAISEACPEVSSSGIEQIREKQVNAIVPREPMAR